MLVSRPDYAKYPFTREVSDYIKALDLHLEELDGPEYVEIVGRAEKRLEEALVLGIVTWGADQVNEAEILSFPVAVAVVANIGDGFLRRRYALAEAKRVYQILKEENEEKLVEIASASLGWRTRIVPHSPGKLSGPVLYFVDYLRNAFGFHDDRWKLVNRTMSGGDVFLKKEELARLVGEEVRTRYERMLERSPQAELPPMLAQRAEGIKALLAQRKESLRMEELPRTIVAAAYPPCIKKLHDSLLAGQHIPHMGRFTLTSFLLHISMSTENLIKLYTSVSDFSESLTRYQVEHIAGQKGSGTKYRPPNCSTLKTHSLCPGPDEVCASIRHPLSYYRRKAAIIREVRGRQNG